MTGSDQAEHHILWHCSRLSSSEHAVLAQTEDDGYRLRGVAALPRGDLPCHIEYALTIDPGWRPGRAQVTITTPDGAREMALSLHDAGWEVDGNLVPDLAGCSDVDFGWTPVTNTVPIRRLGLDVGQRASITAAWIRFPELDVVSSEQRYTRLALDRWRYTSGEYDYELIVDPSTGLVLSYGDDLWRAVATSAR